MTAMRPSPLILVCCWLAAGAAWAAPPARPDFQGVWTNASGTWLTRAGAGPLVVDAARAAKLAAASPYIAFARGDLASSVSDPKAGALPPGDPTGAPGVFLEAGDSLARVNGEFRTSWIVDPADGQLPLSEEGRRRVAQARAFAQRAGAPSDPEALQPWDRCLIGSRGSGGPGMLNNIYNSNYQIVQTKDAVAIVVEMIHEPRIIPILPSKAQALAAHRPPSMPRWLGDSVGWWEGATLVVDTVNVNGEQGRAGPIFLTPQGRVTERFRRASPTALFYSFEVEDAAYYARPWRAEMTLTARPEPLYEYACHEGNYALPGILRGVRVAEGRAAEGL